MANFRYKARDMEGKPVEGILVAESEQSLAEKLSEMDLILIDNKIIKNLEAASISFGKIKRRDIILFTNHLATSVEAGVPVISAISDYAAETENIRFAKMIRDIERQVMSGTSLSEAFSKHPKAFSPIYISVVSTGEATGNLDKVLNDLVRFIEWQEELLAQIRQASIYPMFLISMIIGVIVIMMTVTLPKFIPVLTGFGVELPAPTRILIKISEFFSEYLVWMFLGLVAFIIIYIVSNKYDNGKHFWDSLKLKTPLLGKLQKKIILSKFAHYFSMLYSSGIGVLESFSILQDIVGNEVLKRAIHRCSEDIEKGSSIYDALVKEKIFPPLILRMIQVGESTGKLDTSLHKVSQYYDKEVPQTINKIFAAFEPILIIAMGGIVLFIALSIFLPIYKLTSAMGANR